mgnify:CR=1 FL=1
MSGRYDLKYSCGNDSTIVDYKTGSIIPTKVSVTSGESLQLPFYTLLEPNTSVAEYLVINDVDYGFIGTLSSLEPTVGYAINLQNSSSLTYPESDFYLTNENPLNLSNTCKAKDLLYEEHDKALLGVR